MAKQTKIAIVICLSFLIIGFFSVEGFHWNNLKYTGEAITSDEVSHIPSGYYYLKTGRYLINPEHPPLVKDIAALPLLILNPALPKIVDESDLEPDFTRQRYPYASFDFSRELETDNAQWDWGRVFLFNPQNNPDTILFWSRLSVILFNSIFLFVLYFFVSKIWGRNSALLGLFLLAFSPFSIAHGSLVTMDFMSAVLQITSLSALAFCLKKYIDGEKAFWIFTVSIFLLALALLSKFSSVIIIPAAFLGGAVYVLYKKRSFKSFAAYSFWSAVLGIAVLLAISLFYYFHVRNMSGGEVITQIQNNYPKEFPEFGANFLSSLALYNPLTRALSEYFVGVMMVFSRMSDALQFIYFLGSTYRSEGAGSLYFPVLYFAKLSVGLIILNIVAIISAFFRLFFSRDSLKEKFDLLFVNPFSFILFSFAYLYTLSSLSSNLQIGLRHIFPVIAAASFLTGRELMKSWNEKLFGWIKTKYVFFFISLSIMATVFLSFPNYLPYYNFAAGGIDNGYKVATDSNYDWGGQDVKALAQWAKDNNIQKIYAHIFTNVPLEYYLGSAYEQYNIEWQDLPEKGSYIAVSASELQNNIYNKELPSNKKYSVLKDDLAARVGKSIFVFRVR
ncbi:MAG: glycosyltransferase family 39 protein [bacterium]|nr:glycosyltransferase family 39 protein [bacterium]